MGIHFIWQGSGPTDNVPVQDGYLAHYRMPLLDCKPQVKDTTVVDRFGARLAERLTHVWSRLPGVALGWRPVENVNTKACSKAVDKLLTICTQGNSQALSANGGKLAVAQGERKTVCERSRYEMGLCTRYFHIITKSRVEEATVETLRAADDNV
ncbi:hypothetical protein ElyMa_004446200 [Elysia marginata]|uniref:Uncharacterized protein n=1 Tax=Elysia marginata TaxID=1093978 RepID=A0AAV4HEJ7_9GAST|nr:hypothetical protein ElyMa_004446200 [Elysia marginata]